MEKLLFKTFQFLSHQCGSCWLDIDVNSLGNLAILYWAYNYQVLAETHYGFLVLVHKNSTTVAEGFFMQLKEDSLGMMIGHEIENLTKIMDFGKYPIQ